MAGRATGALDLGPVAGANRLVDSIAGRLKHAIIDGTLAPGTQLSVPALARTLAVSRSPVREAVLQLVGHGLAVEQPRRGVVVATVDQEDLVRIHEIREYLEAAAARYCAERIADRSIATLEATLVRQKQAVDAADAQLYYESNAELHRLIAEGAGNPGLVRMLEHLEGQMAIALRRISTSRAHMRSGYREHVQIVSQLRARDAAKAEGAMRAHIAATLARVRQQQAAD
ncbi:MAG: GntR family transcriptional regulator [Proteobacteria bacterium]|nr:MAG: GntR family transcriptional regulator [Pseudomonadota bacterium]